MVMIKTDTGDLQVLAIHINFQADVHRAVLSKSPIHKEA